MQANNVIEGRWVRGEATLSPSTFVAVITGSCAVNVPAYAVVLWVSLCLLMGRLRVAIDAGKRGIVRGNQVAIAANRAVMRNREKGVVEGSAQPRGGVMATVARRGITGSNVIRNCSTQLRRTLPCGNVAAIAGRIRGGQSVVVVGVALIARGIRQVVSG
jgi:hypothetical protein